MGADAPVKWDAQDLSILEIWQVTHFTRGLY